MTHPTDRSARRLISEAVRPEPDSFDTAAMSRGEPGLPHRFAWRGRAYRVTATLERWKTSGPCSHGSGERYVRRHWWRVATEQGAIMTLYCLRRPPRRSAPAARRERWILYTIDPVGDHASPDRPQP